MSNVSRQVLPFCDVKAVQVFNSEVQTLFNFHYERISKSCNFLFLSPVQGTDDKAKFSQFWRGIIEEICGSSLSITTLSDQTNIPVKLLTELCWNDNSNSTTITTLDAEKLLVFHSKTRPDLQPKTQE